MQTNVAIDMPYVDRDFVLPGTVNVLDCQDNWVDVRELGGPEEDPVASIFVYVRCHLLLSKQCCQGSTADTWYLSSSTHIPCSVRSPVLQQRFLIFIVLYASLVTQGVLDLITVCQHRTDFVQALNKAAQKA
jgi:hypothetical protein